MEVKSKKDVTWYEAREIMEKFDEGSLLYEQKNALNFLRKFCKLKKSDAEALVKTLRDMGKLNERVIINIVNFLPKNIEELNTILSYETVVLSEEEKKKILDAVKSFTR